MPTIALLGFSAMAQGGSVVSAWNYAGRSSTDGYYLYDYIVQNNSSEAIGSMSLHFGLAGPATMLDESSFSFASAELTAGSWTQKLPTSGGFQALQGALGFEDPDSTFAAGTMKTVAQLALPDGTDPTDVVVAGLRGDQPFGPASFTFGSDPTRYSLIQAIPGDLNLDGRFGYGDLIEAILAGTYNTGLPADWTSGDVDYDGLFTYRDMIKMIVQGGGQFNQGDYAVNEVLPALAPPGAPMPEPLSMATFCLAGLGLYRTARKRSRR
jgi:hypothetical protein